MWYYINRHGGYGEVVNTLDCGSNIRGFDSHYPSHEWENQTFWFVNIAKARILSRKS